MNEMTDFSSKKCKPCEGSTMPLSALEAGKMLASLPGWRLDSGQITKTFLFKNYYETTAFVNAVVWLSHREDHHPDILFGYKQCKVNYTTHAVKGLTENDFVCAAKVNALLSN